MTQFVCPFCYNRAPALVAETTASTKSVAIDSARYLLLYLNEIYGSDAFTYRTKFNVGQDWELARAMSTQDINIKKQCEDWPVFCQTHNARSVAAESTLQFDATQFFSKVRSIVYK